MQWVSTLHADADFADAVASAVAAIGARLGGAPDLVVAFISNHHRERWPALPRVLRGQWPNVRVVGCSGAGIAGNGREVEGQPALALTAAILPGVSLRPFHLSVDQVPDAGDDAGWATAFDLDPAAPPAAMLLLPDPFSFPVDRTLAAFDAICPEVPIFGGMISGGNAPGEHALFLDADTYDHGVVGLGFSGNVAVQTVVAQGCKPVGDPMFVTAAEGRLLRQLDGFLATDMVQRVYAGLSADDRPLARQALFLGLGMHPDRQTYARGDFLVRHLLGADADSGTLIAAAHLRPNQVVQFHLRDAGTSAEDLNVMLRRAHAAQPAPPAGALLFSCLGRGVGLYGQPDYDSEAIREHFGADLALAGFFCNGEIGPVQGRSWVHGYTSVIALFRPAEG